VKILLRDLDNTGFGNLALMKLSAWHKAKGDQVYLDQAAEWDKCFVSCVFTYNINANTYPPDADQGGWGFKLRAELPNEIEHTKPDYFLYGHDPGVSMGFTSRGCIRHCPWCSVPEKEGGIQPWASIYEFWDGVHPRIKLLDNNLLASPNWRDTMDDLLREQVKVDFNQGLDIRLVTDEVAWYLRRINIYPVLRFSFDEWALYRSVEEGISTLSAAGITISQLQFYVLLGHKLDADEDYARLMFLQEKGCSIFPMIYVDSYGVKHPPLPGRLPGKMRGHRDGIRKLARLKGIVP